MHMRIHNPLEAHDVPDRFTIAQRFALLVRRTGPPTVATGERNARMTGQLTPDVMRHIEAAVHILRVDIDFFKITPQYIYITLLRKET